MNAVARYVHENWESFGRGTPPRRLRSFLRTPRFRASSHVLLFLFADTEGTPCVVAKVPRLKDQCEFLDREAENLRAVHDLCPGGWDSIPRVLSYAELDGLPVLVQSIVSGQSLGPAYVRRHAKRSAASVVAWLTELHAASPENEVRLGSFLERDVAALAETGSAELLDATRRLVEPVADRCVPAVFEHGDLSSPNILVDADGTVRVVDWELAEPAGMPAADLFFFLNYVAVARANAGSARTRDEAFRRAFFGSDAWAWHAADPYRERLGLDSDVLRALFVLTWARYVAVTLARLTSGDEGAGNGDASRWLRESRWLRLWRAAVDHASEVQP